MNESRISTLARMLQEGGAIPVINGKTISKDAVDLERAFAGLATIPDRFDIAIFHSSCGAFAFYYESRGELPGGRVIESERARFPDGTKPDMGQPFLCGSCGGSMLGMVIWERRKQ